MQPDLVNYSTADALHIYRLHCQSQRYRPSTLNYHSWTLNPFVAWLATQDATALRHVTATHLRTYLANKAAGGASGNYVNAIARALRAWLNFCVREEMIQVSPMRNVTMPKKPKQILPSLRAEDIRKLVRAARDEREKLLVHFLLDTGVRASECAKLRVLDVDTASGSVSIRAGKGEKDRVVYIGATTGRMLLRYIRRGGLADNDPLWPSLRGGGQIGYSAIAKILRELGKRAGVPRCTAHAFRRTYALTSLRNGMDLYTLARLMGHADIDILKQYLDINSHDLESAARQFGVVDNL